MSRYLLELFYRALRWVGWAKGMLLGLTPLIPTDWFARIGVPVNEAASGKNLAFWGYQKIGPAWSIVLILLLLQWIALRAAFVMYREAAPRVRTVSRLGLLWGPGPDGENVAYCPSCRAQKGGPYPLHLPVTGGARTSPSSGGVATAIVPAVVLICHHPSHRQPARFSVDPDRFLEALRDQELTAGL